ncbi:MAG TPA: 8-amino-7-oxononanoate synthase [Candidatus Limnocylindria bacterium]|nr:8-amino-7-oxononanoate synthase [Candidatus Limnocylindria bacterium]
MSDFELELQRELESIRGAGLHRELRRVDSPQGTRIIADGRTLLNFSSNDYLGFANHPALKEAAIKAVEKFGAGTGASRLICGSLAPHHELEEALANFKGTEAALTFSTGYATALGTIGSLVGKEDVIVLDKLVHASIVDAARLSGAKLRVFAHNDLNDLERILRWASARVQGAESKVQSRKPRVLIVTESVFSMDGDLAPLRDIVELKDCHGAWLMIDEAHATGLFGAQRRGLAEAHEVSERIEIQMGTLGKALGASGGYVCGSRSLIDLLVNRARSFIFSTAPVPAAAAAARAAIQLLQSSEGEERRVHVWSLVDQLKNALVETDFKVPVVQSAIVPLIVGAEADAMSLAHYLRDHHVFVPAIRFPTVARGEARLRITLTADHTTEDVHQLVNVLKTCPRPRS